VIQSNPTTERWEAYEQSALPCTNTACNTATCEKLPEHTSSQSSQSQHVFPPGQEPEAAADDMEIGMHEPTPLCWGFFLVFLQLEVNEEQEPAFF
jgi:hypothetical protein